MEHYKPTNTIIEDRFFFEMNINKLSLFFLCENIKYILSSSIVLRHSIGFFYRLRRKYIIIIIIIIIISDQLVIRKHYAL